MTTNSATTLKAFGTIFTRLTNQLQSRDIDLETLQDYHRVLGHATASELQATADRLAAEPGRRWLPTTGEWQAELQRYRTGVLRAAVSHREEPWHEECADCGDTGWRQGLHCPGDATCGRHRPHGAHSYTAVCPCRASNATYRRRAQQYV